VRRRRRGHGGGGGGGKEEGGGKEVLLGSAIGGVGANQWGNLGLGYESTIVQQFTEGVQLASRGTVKKVLCSGGGSALFALMENGDIWAEGANPNGQICDGTFLNKPEAVKTLLKGVEDFEMGGGWGIAKLLDGSIVTWGSNGSGQLGNGNFLKGTEGSRLVDLNEPFTVYGPSAGVVAIAAGGANAGVVFASGAVAMWGNNNNAQIGNGTEDTTGEENPVPEPVVVWPIAPRKPGELSVGERAVEIAIGAVAKSSAHVLMRRKDGRLMAWGVKGNGECAIEPFTSGVGHNLEKPTLVPNESGGKPIPGLVEVVAMFATPKMSYTINSKKELFFCGADWHWGGGIGFVLTEAERNETIKPGVGTKAEQEARETTLAKSEWAMTVFPPRKAHDNIVHMACEQGVLAAVTTTGEILTCGTNGKTQCGRGETSDEVGSCVPSLAAAPGVKDAVEASASIETLIVRCESCTAKPIFKMLALLRAVKVEWFPPTSAPWTAVVRKLPAPVEEELSEEEEEEGGAQYARRFPLHPGADVLGGSLHIAPSGTFKEAIAKLTTVAEGEPKPALPRVEDSTSGHRSEATLDMTTEEAKQLVAELEASLIKIKAFKYKVFGELGTATRTIGLEWSDVIGTLTSALTTGGPITTLAVSALSEAITKGASFQVNDGAGHRQLWTTTATAAKGATSIAVVSQTPNFAYPAPTTKVEPSVSTFTLNAKGKTGPNWFQGKLLNSLIGLITGTALSAMRLFVEVGSAPMVINEIYLQVEAEYTIDNNAVPAEEHHFTAKEWKGKPLEPGDLFRVLISKGPVGWTNPQNQRIVLGIRTGTGTTKLPEVKAGKSASGSLALEAFGARAKEAFSISGQPVGMTINRDTGLIEYKAGTTAESKTVTIKCEIVNDEGHVEVDTVTFVWTVS
jgi:alpha-tubulin suppressor-like RCC1 family protein